MTSAMSPFLPGTNVQFACAETLVRTLLMKGTRHGECLICHLAPNAKGYANVQVGGRAGVKFRAHRLVFFVRKHPTDLMVLHSCDVRNCIEPNHLFEGTAQDNTQDMMAKGRNGFGTRQPLFREEIRKLLSEGMHPQVIANKLHVSRSTVYYHGRDLDHD